MNRDEVHDSKMYNDEGFALNHVMDDELVKALNVVKEAIHTLAQYNHDTDANDLMAEL